MHSALPLYSVAQARAIDRAALLALGLADDALMQRAGAAALSVLRRRWPAARRLLVACGQGNNGGDGYVLARLARAEGLQVEVLASSGAAPGTPEAARAAAAWQAGGGVVRVFDGVRPDLREVDVVVDALLGIGLASPPREPMAALMRSLDACGRPLLALDVPSGLDADSGDAPGAVLRADATISFIVHKRGLFTGRAPDCTGEVELAALGVPDAVLSADQPAAWLLHSAALQPLLSAALPPRRRGAHKGEHGHVLVLGGDHGMGGAARLAAEAAARCGAGLVSVATRTAHVAALLGARPALMVTGIEADDAAGAGEALAHPIARASVLAAGPGLGRGGWGQSLLAAALGAGKPLVLDADALNLLAAGGAAGPWRQQLHDAPGDAVLTPHPAEAARLLGGQTDAVQRDRYAAAAALAAQSGCVIVLKGSGTIVQAPARPPVVIGAGNPGLASGGTGDVLTGVVAALRAQGLAAFDAASVGALLHAVAGDAAAQEGERGMLAGDLLPMLRRLCNPPREACS